MDRTIRVIASDGNVVGKLAHVVAERGAQRPTGLVIEREGNEVVLPLAAVHGSYGELVTLNGASAEYSDLPPFVRVHYRVIDEEIAMREELDEDFQVGGEDDEEAPARGQHTGAENPYRAPIGQPGEQDGIAQDATDQDHGPAEEAAARTRRDMR